jgi:hypothetical protein
MAGGDIQEILSCAGTVLNYHKQLVGAGNPQPSGTEAGTRPKRRRDDDTSDTNECKCMSCQFIPRSDEV